VGLLVAVRAAARFALWVYAAFLRPGKPLRRRYGAWAVVTGATDGIGRAVAFRLAASGLGLVLVGRNQEKLAAVAAEIKARHPKVPEVRTFVLDFAGEGLAAGVEALKDSIRGLDVGVLVNNAGVSYPYARYFHEVDEELMRTLIRVNVEGVTRVTHAVLPAMVERKRGAIVNIGSGAASVVPSDPLYSVYAATKA
jgi:17beta-estradiol 17-dehydrogenase / very-long-chain 3-oxoacyl-CoA reductase